MNPPTLLNHPFDAQTSLSKLILKHYDLLMVITRFGIPLGFGDKSVGEVCQANGVDTNTLLAVVNMLTTQSDTIPGELLHEISAESLIAYLQRSHHYFLDYKLPDLRGNLFTAVEEGSPEVAALIHRFYDAYVGEVHKHMGYEDEVLFPYVHRLLKGDRDKNYSIDEFESRHDHIEMKITDLKNILIKYYQSMGDYALTNVLHELFTTESDLMWHNHIEDCLFVPLIKQIEDTLQASNRHA